MNISEYCLISVSLMGRHWNPPTCDRKVRGVTILSWNQMRYWFNVTKGGSKRAWEGYTYGDSPSRHSCPHMLSSRRNAKTLGYTASSRCGRQTAPGCSVALKHNKTGHVVKAARDKVLFPSNHLIMCVKVIWSWPWKVIWDCRWWWGEDLGGMGHMSNIKRSLNGLWVETWKIRKYQSKIYQQS